MITPLRIGELFLVSRFTVTRAWADGTCRVVLCPGEPVVIFSEVRRMPYPRNPSCLIAEIELLTSYGMLPLQVMCSRSIDEIHEWMEDYFVDLPGGGG